MTVKIGFLNEFVKKDAWKMVSFHLLSVFGITLLTRSTWRFYRASFIAVIYLTPNFQNALKGPYLVLSGPACNYE